MTTATKGRENQKTRTRRGIIAAAAKLIAAGTLPTVPLAAEEALVSTATAYRYFPDQMSLLSAALRDSLGDVGERFRPELGDERDVVRRVDLATEGILRRVVEREPVVRAVVALSLMRSLDEASRADAATIRPGFRHAWIEEALRPVEEGARAEELQRLKLALGVVMSSEAMIALEDVMGIGSDDAIDVCRWMARTLTAAALRPATG